MLRAFKHFLVAVPSFALVAVLAATTACGGGMPPEPPSTDTIDASAGADMPAPPSTVATEADAGPPATDTPAPNVPNPSATLALPSGSAKVALKGKKPGNVEIKSDGSVMSGAKSVGKISGMAMHNADGKDLLTVGSDGAVTTDGGSAYGSFSGDELTLAKGDKLSVADDGTVTMTSGGKPAVLGKFDGVGSAKRAAVLAVAFAVAPPAADKPAVAAKPANKPAKPKKP